VPQDRPFALDDETLVGVCGDAWGPKPRIEQAWLSGDALGRDLAARLA
jgi:predicted NAD/FAD-dependent oxidoreductase